MHVDDGMLGRVGSGALGRLAKEVWREMGQDPKMCLGLVRQQFSDERWSVIVITMLGTQALGYFDEVRGGLSCA
jgi:hypothetical protein